MLVRFVVAGWVCGFSMGSEVGGRFESASIGYTVALGSASIGSAVALGSASIGSAVALECASLLLAHGLRPMEKDRHEFSYMQA